jgi:hypothetical protein
MPREDGRGPTARPLDPGPGGPDRTASADSLQGESRKDV